MTNNNDYKKLLLIIIFTFIFIYFICGCCKFDDKIQEYLDPSLSPSNEAIANLAAMYNVNKITSDNLQATNNITGKTINSSEMESTGINVKNLNADVADITKVNADMADVKKMNVSGEEIMAVDGSKTLNYLTIGGQDIRNYLIACIFMDCTNDGDYEQYGSGGPGNRILIHYPPELKNTMDSEWGKFYELWGNPLPLTVGKYGLVHGSSVIARSEFIKVNSGFKVSIFTNVYFGGNEYIITGPYFANLEGGKNTVNEDLRNATKSVIVYINPAGFPLKGSFAKK
jgi:hypothetical protein